MKTPSICFVMLFFLSFGISAKTDLKINDTIAKKIESKNFTVKVNYADPLRMEPVYLTSDYDLKIKNDSAFAYLPYFGVAYIAPYGNTDGGIKFAEPITDYSIVPNKKKDGWKINFKIKSKMSLYYISMDIFINGNASFTVSSHERDIIRFNGEVLTD